MNKYAKGVSRGVHNIAFTVTPNMVSIVQYHNLCKKSKRLCIIVWCCNKHNRALNGVLYCDQSLCVI